MDLSSKSIEELKFLSKLHNIYVPCQYRSRKLFENYLYKHINFKVSTYQLIIFLEIKIDPEFILYTSNVSKYIKEYFNDIIYILFNELDFETFDFDIHYQCKINKLRIIFQRKHPFTLKDYHFCNQIYKDNYILLQEVFLNPLEKNLVKFGFPGNFTFDLDLESIFLTVL
jgi:hypothetical protein